MTVTLFMDDLSLNQGSITNESNGVKILLGFIFNSTFFSHGPGSPVVSECDGDYTYEKRGALLWQLPVIDGSNKTGSMEFSCHGCPDDFFPIRVSFYSKKAYSGILVSFKTKPFYCLFFCLDNLFHFLYILIHVP
jgi:hypothetical protein